VLRSRHPRHQTWRCAEHPPGTAGIRDAARDSSSTAGGPGLSWRCDERVRALSEALLPVSGGVLVALGAPEGGLCWSGVCRTKPSLWLQSKSPPHPKQASSLPCNAAAGEPPCWQGTALPGSHLSAFAPHSAFRPVEDGGIHIPGGGKHSTPTPGRAGGRQPPERC